MSGLKRGGAAIVGAAESDLGQVAEGMGPIDLMAQGITRALEDCGLALKDVDGLLCAATQSRTSGLSLSEYLGISPSFIDTTILGGSSFMFHVAHALAAIQLGLCNVAVIAYGSTQRSVGRRQAAERDHVHMRQGGLLPDRSQHRSSIVLRQMQIQDDDARFWIGVSHPLSVHKSDGLLTVAKQIELVLFAVIVESEAEQVHVRWIIFHYENFRRLGVSAHLPVRRTCH